MGVLGWNKYIGEKPDFLLSEKGVSNKEKEIFNIYTYTKMKRGL